MQPREDRNSSCGLFLAIMFVLMLLGNHPPPEKRYNWSNHHSTTLPPLISLEPDNGTGDFFSDPTPPGRYSYTWPTANPDVQRRNQQSARVVVVLFASLMLVQVLGFCVVIALRRRAHARARNSDLFNVAVTRNGNGWADYDSDIEDIEDHPALASLRETNEVGLPSYDEAIRDPNDLGLPSYSAEPEQLPPMSLPSGIDACNSGSISTDPDQGFNHLTSSSRLIEADQDIESSVTVASVRGGMTTTNQLGSELDDNDSLVLDPDDMDSDVEDDKAPLIQDSR